MFIRSLTRRHCVAMATTVGRVGVSKDKLVRPCAWALLGVFARLNFFRNFFIYVFGMA